ncbi:MAG: hypothetical protein V1809_00210 [Planctomycetota bacterium]
MASCRFDAIAEGSIANGERNDLPTERQRDGYESAHEKNGAAILEDEMRFNSDGFGYAKPVQIRPHERKEVFPGGNGPLCFRRMPKFIRNVFGVPTDCRRPDISTEQTRRDDSL